MFESVSPKLDVNEMELAILKFWKNQNVFERVTTMRVGGPEYVFYEGPPTANGRPVSIMGWRVLSKTFSHVTM